MIHPSNLDPVPGQSSLTIDTVAVLDELHVAFDHLHQGAELDEESKRQLVDSARSAWNALVPYLQDRQSPVQQAHYDSIQKFLDLVALNRTRPVH